MSYSYILHNKVSISLQKHAALVMWNTPVTSYTNNPPWIGAKIVDLKNSLLTVKNFNILWLPLLSYPSAYLSVVLKFRIGSIHLVYPKYGFHAMTFSFSWYLVTHNTKPSQWNTTDISLWLSLYISFTDISTMPLGIPWRSNLTEQSL